MKLTRTVQLELGQRKAGAKVIPATVSTSTPVKRRDWERGEFLEVLSHKKGAVNLERSPLPLLVSHNGRELPVGKVDNLRIAGGKLRGEVTFGASARAAEIAADVEAGIVTNLSVGYTIDEAVESERDGTVTITATRWTPHEASVVSIPADAGAGFNRSQGDRTMLTRNRNRTGHPADDGQGEADFETIDEEIAHHRAAGDEVRAERVRVAAIGRLVRDCDLDSELGDEWIESGISFATAQARAIDLRYQMRQRTAPVERGDSRLRVDVGDGYGRGYGRASAVDEVRSDFCAAAVDAILMRAGVSVPDPHPAARDIDASVRALAQVCVSRAGRTVRGGWFGGGGDRLIRTAMTTSDFPLILADVMHKAVRRGYEDEPSSHRAWVRIVPVPDFRDQHRPILGSAPGLDEVPEGAEYTQGPLSEDSTSYRVTKYGKVVPLTYEALTNDDLPAFIRIKPAMGQAARRKESDVVYTLLESNPAMQDTKALFHADHNNIVNAGALSATTLGKGRELLRKQTAVGGGFLSLIPRFLIVPPELETDAEILLAQATKHVNMAGTVPDPAGGSTATTNAGTEAMTPRWLRNLELVVEPRIGANNAYLAAGPDQIDTGELGLLEENFGGPTLQEEMQFEADIMRWKVRHVAGAKFLDWRGMVWLPQS